MEGIFGAKKEKFLARKKIWRELFAADEDASSGGRGRGRRQRTERTKAEDEDASSGGSGGREREQRRQRTRAAEAEDEGRGRGREQRKQGTRAAEAEDACSGGRRRVQWQAKTRAGREGYVRSRHGRGRPRTRPRAPRRRGGLVPTPPASVDLVHCTWRSVGHQAEDRRKPWSWWALPRGARARRSARRASTRPVCPCTTWRPRLRSPSRTLRPLRSTACKVRAVARGLPANRGAHPTSFRRAAGPGRGGSSARDRDGQGA